MDAVTHVTENTMADQLQGWCLHSSMSRQIPRTNGIYVACWAKTNVFPPCSTIGRESGPICEDMPMLINGRTFYTRDDFAEIKAAGLNAVRIPLGYWAVDLLDYEPYVSGQVGAYQSRVSYRQNLIRGSTHISSRPCNGHGTSTSPSLLTCTVRPARRTDTRAPGSTVP